MRRSMYRAQEEESEIDLTPMLDVVFIMLIFFIVTASFVKEVAIEVDRPDASNAPPPDDDNAAVVVTVRESNDFYIEGRRIDVRALRSNIERLHAERPKAPVIVRAHAKAHAKAFVAVADAAREAGVYEVSLVKD